MTRSQTLDSADTELTHIASGLEVKAEARYDYALLQVPPSVQEALKKRSDPERSDAAVLALHLAEGRNNPRGTAESLLAASPGWIERNSFWAWQVIASYAAEHEHYDVSADAFERAARSPSDHQGRLLSAAALNIMPTDRHRSEDLLDRAEATGQEPLLVALGRALLRHPEGDAGPLQIDRLFLEETDDVRRSGAVQGFLADQARRAGDLDAALRHSQLRLAAEPCSSSAMIDQAEILLRRWNSPSGPVDDLPAAVKLLNAAIKQRREWSGRSLEGVLALAQAYALDGRFEAMLDACLARPTGSASVAEAADPRIRRFAILAASFLGRLDVVSDLVAELGEPVEDRILSLRVGALELTDDEERELWHEELDRAISESDYRQIATAGIALANLGVDERIRLRCFVDQSIIPSSLLDLAGALVTAHISLDAALPALRELARTDMIAAEYLITKLRSAGMHVEAAQACAVLHKASGNPLFLIERATCLIGAEEGTAEVVAAAAVTSTSGHPIQRGRLLTFLGARAGERDEWDLAENHFSNVLKLFASPNADAVWRLVIAQLNQGKLARAAKTVDAYRPAVREMDEAELWLHAYASVRWDEAKASEALTLARRFNDPKLSTALLGRIITATRGVSGAPASESENRESSSLDARRRLAQPAVPADLHRMAFAAMEELVTEFGDATGIRVLNGEPEYLVEQMTELIKDGATAAEPLEKLVEAAQNATLPIGFVAGVRGLGYASVLVQRALGVLLSGSPDDDEHAVEVETALAALGTSVVVDAASLLVISGMSSAAHLSGQFLSLQLAAPAMSDIHRAAFDIRGLAGSPGSVSWDRTGDVILFHELPEAEFTRQLRRAQGLEDLAQTLPGRAVDGLRLFDKKLDGPKHAPWAYTIQLAHDEGVSLWSDDLGLRRMARSVGVAGFGTPALIDAVRDRALEMSSSTDADHAAIQAAVIDNLNLASDLVVDLALDSGDVEILAERDDWIPRAGGAVLSRAAWWAWQGTPFDDLMALYARVRETRPDALPHWQHAAMLGAARAYRPVDAAAKMLAVLALSGDGTEPTTAEAVDGMRRARAVATGLNLPDPMSQLPAAASSLAKAGRCHDPETVMTAVLDLLTGENDADNTTPSAD